MDKPRLSRVTCTEGRRVTRRARPVKRPPTLTPDLDRTQRRRPGYASRRAERRLLVHRSEVAHAHRAAGRGPLATGADALRASRRSLYERVQPPAVRAARREAPGPDARAGARGMAASGARARRRDPAALPRRLARGMA